MGGRVMIRHLHWKVVAILVVLVTFAAVGVYPIVAVFYGIQSPRWLMAHQLKLGLDLQGGVHLVLRPETDVALRLETAHAVERLSETLRTQGVAVAAVSAPDSTHIHV